jgi:fucose 4-O-acetylase-like acetyltransferase
MRFGQVIGLLGILMLIDGNFKVKAPLFLKLGQNTLPIYVIHVIILYGGIFGIGLKPDVINLNLSPYESIGVSVIAMLSFTIMVKYIEPLEEVYNSVQKKMFFWRKKN